MGLSDVFLVREGRPGPEKGRGSLTQMLAALRSFAVAEGFEWRWIFGELEEELRGMGLELPDELGPGEPAGPGRWTWLFEPEWRADADDPQDTYDDHAQPTRVRLTPPEGDWSLEFEDGASHAWDWTWGRVPWP